jgi:hypothetical protein
MSTTAEKIDILKAFGNGEIIIETDCNGLLTNIQEKTYPNYDFDFYAHSYEIRPRPKIIYVNEYGHGEHYAYEAVEVALSCECESARKAVKYIELTPELEQLAKDRGLV